MALRECRRHSRFLVRVLAAVLLLALGSLPSSRADAAPDADVSAKQMAAPAVVAAPDNLDVTVGRVLKVNPAVNNETVGDSWDDPAGDAEDLEEGDSLGGSGSRGARFLPWTSVTRMATPGPTMATFTHRAAQLSDILRRAAKFLSAFASSQEEDAANEIDVDAESAERKEGAGEEGSGSGSGSGPQDDSPGSALSGLYSECLLRLSVPCVQRKLLLFLDRLGRMERFRLLGDFLTVVRVEPRNGEARRHILDEDADVTDLGEMADRLVDDFFDTHVIRFTLPGTLRVGRSPRTTVDIALERPQVLGSFGSQSQSAEEPEHGVVEGRGSIGSIGGGNSKKKQKMLKKIKKKLMKLLMMIMSVMMVMGPMSGGMAGNAAGMAIMLGLLAIIILKALIIKQMGGSVSGLVGNVGNSFGNLANIPGLPGGQQSTNYQPSGAGGGPYQRSDYYGSSSFGTYNGWTQRAFGDSWFGTYDPMSLAYRAYMIASQLK